MMFGGLLGGLLGGSMGGMSGDTESMGAFALLGSIGGMMLGVFLVGNLYNLIEAFTGASPGKMMIGIKIGNEDGTPAPLSKLFLRYVLKNIMYIFSTLAGIVGLDFLQTVGAILGLVWFIGCFFALGKARQALHDKILKTAVYYKATLNA